MSMNERAAGRHGPAASKRLRALRMALIATAATAVSSVPAGARAQGAADPNLVRAFAPVAEGLAGRWSSGDCAVRWYDWSVSGLSIRFVDQAGKVDVEQVVQLRPGEFLTRAVGADRRPGVPGGAVWLYQLQTSDRIRVQNLSTGASFLQQRCPSTSSSMSASVAPVPMVQTLPPQAPSLAPPNPPPLAWAPGPATPFSSAYPPPSQQSRDDAARAAAVAEVYRRADARQAQVDAAARQRAAAQERAEAVRAGAIQRAAAEQGPALDRLGFPAGVLGARLMMQDVAGRYSPFVTLREYLAVLLAGGAVEQVGYVPGYGAGRHGVRIKAVGRPSAVLVWRLDGPELYLVASEMGGRVEEVFGPASIPAETTIQFTVMQLANQLAAAPVRVVPSAPLAPAPVPTTAPPAVARPLAPSMPSGQHAATATADADPDADDDMEGMDDGISGRGKPAAVLTSKPSALSVPLAQTTPTPRAALNQTAPAAAPVVTPPVMASTSVSAPTVPGGPPATELGLIAAVQAARVQYREAANDMAKGAARPARARAICAALGGRTVRDWIGTVQKLSSNREGKGVLEISIDRDITVGTWDNALSDLGDNTLIDPASPVFNQALTLRKGQRVRFSGQFRPGSLDCVGEMSVTLSGSIQEPEFVFAFESVAPAD